MNEAKKYFWDGVKAEIPLLIGVFPFGMIYGALALNAGLSAFTSQMMSSMVFAGSAQFITAQLVSEAAPGFVIIMTIAVVNLRHMLYSASLAPYLKHLSTKWKVLLSYLLTDEAYAPSILHYEKEGLKPFSHWFLFGAGLALWINWQISTGIGIFLGARISDELQLDFALPLTFIAMVVPVLKYRPLIEASMTQVHPTQPTVPTLKNYSMIATALSAGIVALLTYNLPYRLGIILAAFTGIIIGTIFAGKKSVKETP
jgi:4-azaleucine resistance transporter AzlC